MGEGEVKEKGNCYSGFPINERKERQGKGRLRRWKSVKKKGDSEMREEIGKPESSADSG